MRQMINAPKPWTHAGGNRLNHDGANIRYEHPDGLEAYIEATNSPDEEQLIFRPAVFDGNEQIIEYPPRILDKNTAIERFEEMMKKNSSTTDSK